MRLLLLLAALSSLAYGQITLSTSMDQGRDPDAAPEVPINVIEGESVTFRCEDFPTLQNRPPGNTNFGTGRLSNLRVIDPLTFEFQNVSRSDNEFAFQCRSAAGFTDIGVINVLFAPNYTSPGPQTITEGDTNARIDVSLDANPIPSSFTWSRNGVPITSNNVVLTASSITFTTVRRDDAGTYTVYGNNTAGNGSTTFEIIVQFPPTIAINQSNLTCRGNAFTGCAIMTGATGYLECSAVGVPTPNVTLTTDVDSNNVIVSDNRFTITSAVAGIAGNYTCNASNALGFDEQTIELLVGGAPTVNNLMIDVTSDTEVAITWTFNDNGVPIDPFQVTTICGTRQAIVSPVDVPMMGYEVTFTQNLPADLPSGSECRVRVTATNLLGNDTVENMFTGATMMTTAGGAALSAGISVLLLILTSLVF